MMQGVQSGSMSGFIGDGTTIDKAVLLHDRCEYCYMIAASIVT